MARPLKYGFDTKMTTIRIRTDLLDRAKKLGLNISELTNKVLEQELSLAVYSIDKLEERKKELLLEIEKLRLEISNIDKLIALKKGDLSLLGEKERSDLELALSRIRTVYERHKYEFNAFDFAREVAFTFARELRVKGLDIDADTLLRIALRKEGDSNV